MCNYPYCRPCRTEREGCKCTASDVGCWFCEPSKFQRPPCDPMVSFQQQLVPPVGYRWVLLDSRGWHIGPIREILAKETICREPYTGSQGLLNFLGLAPGMGPSDNYPICQNCVNYLPQLQPIHYQPPLIIVTTSFDFNELRKLEEEVKSKESLVRMLHNKFDPNAKDAAKKQKNIEQQEVALAELQTKLQMLRTAIRNA